MTLGRKDFSITRTDGGAAAAWPLSNEESNTDSCGCRGDLVEMKLQASGGRCAGNWVAQCS